MKKNLLIILTLAVLLVGCGNQQETNSHNADQPTTTESSSAIKPTSTTTEATTTTESTSTTVPTSTTTEATTTTESTSTTVPTSTTKPTSTPTEEASTTEATTTEEPTEPPHEHTYTESITKEGTCTETGEKTFTCDCGNTYTEPINATGHNYGDYVYNNDATTEKDGTKTAVCGICGNRDTKTAVDTKIPTPTYNRDGSFELALLNDDGSVTSTCVLTYDTSIVQYYNNYFGALTFAPISDDDFVPVGNVFYKKGCASGEDYINSKVAEFSKVADSTPEVNNFGSYTTNGYTYEYYNFIYHVDGACYDISAIYVQISTNEYIEIYNVQFWTSLEELVSTAVYISEIKLEPETLWCDGYAKHVWNDMDEYMFWIGDTQEEANDALGPSDELVQSLTILNERYPDRKVYLASGTKDGIPFAFMSTNKENPFWRPTFIWE